MPKILTIRNITENVFQFLFYYKVQLKVWGTSKINSEVTEYNHGCGDWEKWLAGLMTARSSSNGKRTEHC
jgi:hypothetical protein